MNTIELLYIDLFCGAGGTSSGVEYARVGGRKCAKVIACVNHDENAIKSHAANHPKTLHFTEDIRTLELTPLVKHLQKMKRKHPKAKTVLWASLECTNFSKAKGGQPRDADSRTLAEHLFRYIEQLNPDYIQIENVEEFMCWGDLDENGHPISRFEGRSYMRWVKRVMDYGYDYDWRLLNAADFGAYTSRKRFFGQFARKGLPIAFPVQTHAKVTVPFANKERREGSYYPNPDWSELFPGFYKPWKPVREVLDLEDEGWSIFTKKKPLCEKTLERIYAGLVKFVAGGKDRHDEFMMRYNSVRPQDTVKSLDEPCGVVTTENRFAKVKCQCLSKQFSGDPMSKNQGIDQPAGTEQGVGIAIYEDDTPMMRKVKEFMAAYGIIDIKMRMLKIVELKRIMGFPEDYTLIGTQAEQKKFIGNAVEVTMSRVLCEALANKVRNIKIA